MAAASVVPEENRSAETLRCPETASRRVASDGIIARRWFARISVVEPAKNGVLYASSSYRMMPTA